MLNDNPFAILTAVVAPAILTNACSTLAQGTANRIARVVDRSRVVEALRKSGAEKAGGDGSYDYQIKNLRVRAKILLNALRLYYMALAMFALSALAAILGSLMLTFDLQMVFKFIAAFGFFVGSTGVIGIVAGCALMVRETHLALRGLTDEHAEVFGK